MSFHEDGFDFTDWTMPDWTTGVPSGWSPEDLARLEIANKICYQLQKRYQKYEHFYQGTETWNTCGDPPLGPTWGWVQYGVGADDPYYSMHACHFVNAQPQCPNICGGYNWMAPGALELLQGETCLNPDAAIYDEIQNTLVTNACGIEVTNDHPHPIPAGCPAFPGLYGSSVTTTVVDLDGHPFLEQCCWFEECPGEYTLDCCGVCQGDGTSCFEFTGAPTPGGPYSASTGQPCNCVNYEYSTIGNQFNCVGECVNVVTGAGVGNVVLPGECYCGPLSGRPEMSTGYDCNRTDMTSDSWEFLCWEGESEIGDCSTQPPGGYSEETCRAKCEMAAGAVEVDGSQACVQWQSADSPDNPHNVNKCGCSKQGIRPINADIKASSCACGPWKGVDDCGYCRIGMADEAWNDTMDCTGVCGGDAIYDVCGTCAGGETNSAMCDFTVYGYSYMAYVPEDTPTVINFDCFVDALTDPGQVEMNIYPPLPEYGYFDDFSENYECGENCKRFFATYIPEEDFDSLDPQYGDTPILMPINYQCISEGVNSDTFTVTIKVTPENDPPTVENMAPSTNEDQPIEITLICDDSLDSTGTETPDYTFYLNGGLATGTLQGLSFGEDGCEGTPSPPLDNPAWMNCGTPGSSIPGTRTGELTVTYTPNPEQSADDSFTYQCTTRDHDEFDEISWSNEGTVTITVNPVNDPPIATSLDIQTLENTPVTIALECSDVETDDLIYQIGGIGSTVNGTLSDPEDNQQITTGFYYLVGNTVTYTPNTSFIGSDQISYRCSDGTNWSTPYAHVYITVQNIDPPLIPDESWITIPNGLTEYNNYTVEIEESINIELVCGSGTYPPSHYTIYYQNQGGALNSTGIASIVDLTGAVSSLANAIDPTVNTWYSDEFSGYYEFPTNVTNENLNSFDPAGMDTYPEGQDVYSFLTLTYKAQNFWYGVDKIFYSCYKKEDNCPFSWCPVYAQTITTSDWDSTTGVRETYGLDHYLYETESDLDTWAAANEDTAKFIEFREITITTDYSEISTGFGIPNVTIEQSLLNSYDPYSGIDVDTTIFDNTTETLEIADSDKRPALGLFYFKDENELSNNFPINIPDFPVLQPSNFVTNGNGRLIEELYAGYTYEHWGMDGPTPSTNDTEWTGIMKFYPPPTTMDNDEVYGNTADNYYSDYKDTLYGPDVWRDTDTEHCYPVWNQDTDSRCVGAYKPKGGWNYLNYRGTPTGNLYDLYAHPYNPDMLYAGLKGYISANIQNAHLMTTNLICGTGSPAAMFAHWTNSYECYSYGRCLSFVYGGVNEHCAGTDYAMPVESYRTLNQYQKILSTDESTTQGVLPYTSLKVSFWMKTARWEDEENKPAVEVGITWGGNPGRSGNYNPDGNCDEFDSTHADCLCWDGQIPALAPDGLGNYNNCNFYYRPGHNNSLNKIPEEGGSQEYYDGGGGRFLNTKLNVWEKFEYTFNLTVGHVSTVGGLYWLFLQVQYGNDNAGTIYLDDFSVIEGFDFVPDVDVRTKKGPDNYGVGSLIEYYDSVIDEEKYIDTSAPLEAQFYFYPRYNYDKVFDLEKNIIYNDFRNGMFYLYDIDWGDGSPKEFESEPKKLGNNVAVYHTYEKSGIFEITGYMFRMKPDIDYNPLGIVSNQRFTLRINVNENLDEDFRYFGSDGFSFIPYKNTLPLVGGYSEEGIYYKSIKRQLGFIDEDTKISTAFLRDGDKLKTEIALTKMEDLTYKEYKKWSVRYWSHPEDYFGIHTLYTLPDFESLNTEVDWSVIDDDVDWNTLGFPENLFAELSGDQNNYTLHLSTWIKVDEAFDVIDKTFISDNRGYLYINGAQIATAGFFIDSSYSYSFKPNWYKIDMVYTEWDGDDTLDLGFNISDIPEITEGGLLNLEILPHFMIPRYDTTSELIYSGIDYPESELGYSIGDVDITNIRYFNKSKQMYEMLGFTITDDIPNIPRYWKNIIPEGTLFTDRNGITIYNDGRFNIDTSSEQAWIGTNEYGNTYYYPVLPRYDKFGEFIVNEAGEYDYTNNNLPFYLDGPATDEKLSDESLKINITSQQIEQNILDDSSGNQNYGFAFSDYKPKFDNQTLEPHKIKNTDRLRSSKRNGAF